MLWGYNIKNHSLNLRALNAEQNREMAGKGNSLLFEVVETMNQCGQLNSYFIRDIAKSNSFLASILASGVPLVAKCHS